MVSKLKDKLKEKKFVITLEMEPPKGVNPRGILERLHPLLPLVDAVNIADNPMAKMRMSPITMAYLVQRELEVETIFHLTCRDRNLLGLQAELLGAHALGVNNILALTGDQPHRGDHPKATGVFDLDSVGLVELTSVLGQGQDLMGNPLDEPAEFFTGAVVNPTAQDLEVELARMWAKVNAGVGFFQTQPIFSLQQLDKFQELLPKAPKPILYGVMPLKGAKLARYLNNHVPGVNIPQELVSDLEARGQAAGLEFAQELLRNIHTRVAGVHIFPMGDIDLIKTLLKDFRDYEQCA